MLSSFLLKWEKWGPPTKQHSNQPTKTTLYAIAVIASALSAPVVSPFFDALLSSDGSRLSSPSNAVPSVFSRLRDLLVKLREFFVYKAMTPQRTSQ